MTSTGLHKTLKVPRIEDITEIVQRQIEEASQQFQKEAESCSLRTSDSPLSEKITSNHFPEKFIMSSFKYYSTDPIQHLWQYLDKIAIHSHDDFLLSRVFPSSLKSAACN